MSVETRVGMPMDESTHTAEYGEIIRLLTGALWAYEQVNPNFVAYTEMPYAPNRSNSGKDARFPDVMTYDRARLLDYKTRIPDWKQRLFSFVPDLAVKVITPQDMYLDVEDQITRYLNDNVRLILVINPRPKTIRVYTPETIIQLSETDILDGGDVLPGFSLPVRDLFAG
ncbi:MAG: Uma2 family endonuclease [Anaerolineae bacterium]|nr:Uma2 family endonuclease [Anaerolineae bacterium]